LHWRKEFEWRYQKTWAWCSYGEWNSRKSIWYDSKKTFKNKKHKNVSVGWSRWDAQHGFQRINLWYLQIFTVCDIMCYCVSHTTIRNLGNDDQIHEWSNKDFSQKRWIDIRRNQIILCGSWKRRMEIWNLMWSVWYFDNNISCHFLQY